MEFGKKPLISEASVQAVLDSLIFSSSHKTEVISLQYLFLVEEKLLDPKAPASEKQRLYSIQLTLIEIIVSQLKYLRSRFQREVNGHETFDAATRSLSADTRAQSNELMSWSILYYLYVQVDLGLTLDNMAIVIGVTSRTVRRYRIHGVELLTLKLWEKEAKCRRDYHYKGLYSQLRPWVVETFLGREDEIIHVVNKVLDKHETVVYIHGEKGVGKTTFIEQTIIRLMDNMQVDDLLWVNNLKTNDIARFQHHFVNDPNISLKAVFSAFNCVIVLDNVDELLKSAEFEEILSELEGAIVFFSSAIHYTIDSSVIHVPLNNLDNQIAEILIRNNFDHEIPDDIVHYINSLSVGNPSKINYIANYHKYTLPVDTPVNLIAGLKLEQRLLLLFIPPQDGLLINDMDKICETLYLTHLDIEFLLNLKLIKQSQNRIYGQVDPDVIADSLSQISSQIFKIINEIPMQKEPWILPTHILINYNKYLDEITLVSLISKFWRIGLRYGNKAIWHSILLDMPKTSDFGLLIAKAVSHKGMNELHIAESILLELLKLAGLKGDFSIQAEVSLELVKIYRLKNQYQQSLHHLNILNGSLKQYLESKQYNSLILEQAQLALDMNQLEYAMILVTSLDSLESMIIKAETLFRLQNYQPCIEICYRLLSKFNLSNTIRGIIHNLIGRCYQIIDDELAAEEFDLAIEYFSETSNIRHLSRAEINLATVFIYQEEIERAIEMLNHAEELCKVTDDYVGMKIIQKNKSYIHQLIISEY